MGYYRCEVSYRGRQAHGIYQWADRILKAISALEEKYYQKSMKNERQEDAICMSECSQDYDWLEGVICQLEELTVPPIGLCKQGYCAFTEAGYQKYIEYIEDYRWIASKYGYKVEIKDIQPEKILYQDEMQIVFQ